MSTGATPAADEVKCILWTPDGVYQSKLEPPVTTKIQIVLQYRLGSCHSPRSWAPILGQQMRFRSHIMSLLFLFCFDIASKFYTTIANII